MGKLLLDDYSLVIFPELACKIGLNEAIILQQIHYWTEINKEKHQNYFCGRYWVYNTYDSWQEQFPWWSTSTIQRTFSSLEKRKLILVGNYNKLKIDRTKWYCVNYDELKKIFPLCQFDMMEAPKMKPAIPETNTEETGKEKVRKVQSERLHPHPLQEVKPARQTHKKETSIFQKATQHYGIERVKYMLSIVDWYIDTAYPTKTNKSHPEEPTAKRIVFAEKLLACSDETVLDDSVVVAALVRAINEYSECDPTIYYVTTPKVLGYWLIQDEDNGYECVNGTEYAPVDTYF